MRRPRPPTTTTSVTVCLAALCLDQDGQRIIVASDRMVTYPRFIEFEHTVPKKTGSSAHSVTMFAGGRPHWVSFGQ